MPRQSISLSEPNSEWLRSKVESEKEYASNSEVVNDLIRRARESEAELSYIRAKLKAAEQSELLTPAPERLLAEIKATAQDNAKLYNS